METLGSEAGESLKADADVLSRCQLWGNFYVHSIHLRKVFASKGIRSRQEISKMAVQVYQVLSGAILEFPTPSKDNFSQDQMNFIWVMSGYLQV